MTIYVAANWAVCGLVSILLLALFVWQRFLFVKPSVIVVTFFHVCIQWAAAVDAGEIERFLPSPWVFFVLAQLFPLIALSVSVITFRNGAHRVWTRLITRRQSPPRQQGKAILILIFVIAAIIYCYLSIVPVSQTGLYSIFFDPEQSTLAREHSLKELEVGWIRYAFSFTISSFGPLLAAVLFTRLIYRRRKFSLMQCLWVFPAIAAVMIVVSISGARSFAASIVLILSLVWALERGFRLNPLIIIFLGFAGLSLPVVLSIYREGGVISVSKYWQYMTGSIFDRVFHMPMQTGLYYTHYAQTEGFLGVQAVERLSSITGVKYFNAPHELGIIYYPQWASDALNMNTCYVFAYYSYFGVVAMPFCLLGLWLLDFAIIIYKKLSDRLLLACCATVSVASLSLISVEYTVALLSNGIIITLLTAYAVDRFFCSPLNDAKKRPRSLSTHLSPSAP